MSEIAKIRLKVGSMELEYEGDPEFLTDGIEALLETMGGLASKVPAETPPPQVAALEPQSPAVGKIGGEPSAQVSTNTIAAHLDAKTCAELIICALAQLEVQQGNSGVTKKEITDEMKTATSYYNANMRGGNLTQAFKTLVKNKRVNQLPGDKYALTANERKIVEAKLAEIE